MQLPDDFIQTMQSVFEEDGKQFIKKLPQLIEEVSARWNIKDIQAVSNLSFNFVAYARRGEVLSPNDMIENKTKGLGDPTPTYDAVLKIGVPRDELTSEIAALKLFNGNCACKLLESDEEKGFLLLERLKPGMMLSELEDDDERTHIAMDVMENIHAVVAEDGDDSVTNKFIQLSDWFDGLKKIRPYFKGETGPFPKELLERVESFLPELFADKNILLHGDFHHFNILSSERGWLIIDPKGVIGPAGYEIGPLMLNPWIDSMARTSFQIMSKRRVDIIQERTGWEREKIIQWAMAHAVLSSWWNIEDNMDDEYSLECAKIFSELK